MVFRFPQDTTTDLERTVSPDKTFPLVLKIPAVSEYERRSYIMKHNPGMCHIPKAVI